MSSVQLAHPERRQKQKSRLSNFDPRKKPKAWSHQQDLNALRGKKIRFKVDCKDYDGLLVDADQFTIKVRITSYDQGEKDVIFFKSALTYIFSGE